MKIHNDEKLIIIAIVICVFVGLFGFSFAYYTAGTPGVTGNAGSGISGQTESNLNDVVYDAGDSKLSLENAFPGSTATKSFTIQINNNGTATYAIKMDIDTNEFKKCALDNNTYNEVTNKCEIGADELVYTLKRGNTAIASGDLTGASGIITLAHETQSGTVSYTLEIEYKDTNKEQNHNMNKSLNGSLKVEFSS